MKTVLLVPGFHETIDTRDYRALLQAIESKGYRVQFVPIAWRRTGIDEWVAQLWKVYEQFDPQQTILAGFSFGSLIAFVTATKRNPAALWLFSFSPYFSDDIPHFKQWWLDDIGTRRTERFKQLEFAPLIAQIHCPTLIVYGAVEGKQYPLIAKRAEITQQRIAHSSLHIVEGVGHDAADPAYIQAIVKII